MPGAAICSLITMRHHYLHGPGDDEDEEGNLRPVDTVADQDQEETAAVEAGAGALIE